MLVPWKVPPLLGYTLSYTPSAPGWLETGLGSGISFWIFICHYCWKWATNPNLMSDDENWWKWSSNYFFSTLSQTLQMHGLFTYTLDCEKWPFIHKGKWRGEYSHSRIWVPTLPLFCWCLALRDGQLHFDFLLWKDFVRRAHKASTFSVLKFCFLVFHLHDLGCVFVAHFGDPGVDFSVWLEIRETSNPSKMVYICHIANLSDVLFRPLTNCHLLPSLKLT